MKSNATIDKELHVAGYVPAQLLLAGRSEDPDAILGRLEKRSDITITVHKDIPHVALSEGIADRRALSESRLESQPSSAWRNRYGHELGLDGMFLDAGHLLIVGVGYMRDDRKAAVVREAQRNGITVMAVGNGHYGMPALPDLWFAWQLDDKTTTDSSCVRHPRVLSLVPTDGGEFPLYDAVSGEYLEDVDAYGCPNVVLYERSNAFHEDFLDPDRDDGDSYCISDFGADCEEVAAVSAAALLGFREITTVGFVDAYDTLYSQLCEYLASRGVWVDTLDDVDTAYPLKLSAKDYRIWMGSNKLTMPDASKISPKYLIQSKHGGRLLKHRDLLEKFDELKAAWPQFDSMLVRDEIAEARKLLDRPGGCKDCDLKGALALTMDRFHTLHKTEDGFDAIWAKIFPSKPYYVIGGSKHARRNETDTAV